MRRLRLALQDLLGGDALLQLRRGCRRSGGKPLRRLAPVPLGLDARVQCRRGLLFRLFSLARQPCALRVRERALLRRLLRRALRRLSLPRRFHRRRFRGRELPRMLAQTLLCRRALARRGARRLLGRGARLGFGKRARLHLRRFAGRLRRVGLRLQPLALRAPRRGIGQLPLARDARGFAFGLHFRLRRLARGLLGRRVPLRRFERLGLGRGALVRLGRGRLVGAATLLGDRSGPVLCLELHFGLLFRSRIRLVPLGGSLQEAGLGLGARLGALRRVRVLRLVLAHRGGRGALGGDPLVGGGAGFFLALRTRARHRRCRGFDTAALLGKGGRLRVRFLPRLRLLERDALVLLAFARQAHHVRFRGRALLGLAAQLLLARLALAGRLERACLVQRALARLLARLLLGGGALAHRRRGLRFGFRAGAGVARRLLLLAPPALGERGGLLLRLLALACLGERRGLGALALGDQPQGLGLGLRA